MTSGFLGIQSFAEFFHLLFLEGIAKVNLKLLISLAQNIDGKQGVKTQ